MSENIDDGTYTVVQHWMINLGLKGNELLIFAAIYGFSQSDSGMFTGRLTYFAEMFNINYSTVIDVIKKLLDRGLIEKHDGTLTGRWAGCHTYTVPKEVLEIPIPNAGEVLENPISGVGNSNREVLENPIPGVGNSNREVLENPIPGVGKSDSYTINNNINNKYNNSDIERYKRETRFNSFWEIYPKHKAKQDAVKAFSKLNPDDELLERMLGAVKRQARSKQWCEDNGRYIPNAATWINGKRWEDELTEATDVSKDHIKGSNYDMDAIEQNAKEIVEFSL